MIDFGKYNFILTDFHRFIPKISTLSEGRSLRRRKRQTGALVVIFSVGSTPWPTREICGDIQGVGWFSLAEGRGKS